MGWAEEGRGGKVGVNFNGITIKNDLKSELLRAVQELTMGTKEHATWIPALFLMWKDSKHLYADVHNSKLT